MIRMSERQMLKESMIDADALRLTLFKLNEMQARKFDGMNISDEQYARLIQMYENREKRIANIGTEIKGMIRACR